MREFFRGWRRKIGCFLLVMALVFMGGWLRSRHTTDSLRLPTRMHRTPTSVSLVIDNLVSARDCLIWDRAHEDDTDTDPKEEIDLGSRYPIWQSSTTLPNFDQLPLNWRWRSCGFGVVDYVNKEDGIRESFLFIPYWSITIPLALLSACLIFTKSPKRLSTTSHPE